VKCRRGLYIGCYIQTYSSCISVLILYREGEEMYMASQMHSDTACLIWGCHHARKAVSQRNSRLSLYSMAENSLFCSFVVLCRGWLMRERRREKNLLSKERRAERNGRERRKLGRRRREEEERRREEEEGMRHACAAKAESYERFYTAAGKKAGREKATFWRDANG